MGEMKTPNSAICIMCNQDQESSLNQNKTQDQDLEQTGPSEDVKKTELELAVAISCHCSIKSIDHLWEIMKKKKTWKRKYAWENIITPNKMQQINH